MDDLFEGLKSKWQTWAISMDETSRRKRHNYITVFADIDTGRVVHICPGKDASTLKSFSESLESHNSSPDRVNNFCCDMSPAFIRGISDHFPSSSITFDKFHVSKMVNEAVDEVRRVEQIVNRVLKNTRYIWLKNPSSLTKKQSKDLGTLKEMNLKTARAYNLKLNLQFF